MFVVFVKKNKGIKQHQLQIDNFRFNAIKSQFPYISIGAQQSSGSFGHTSSHKTRIYILTPCDLLAI